ncbi:hypothetical protein JCM6882_001001 [Rhodosporidiobolus microsporus]
MAVFSFLFGGGTSSSSSNKRSSSSYPTSSPYPPSSHNAPNGEYDDVALGGPSGSSSAYPPSRPSFSAPTATAGSFVGGGGTGGYSVEASYPPLPSFSRPSGSFSHASPATPGGKYPPLHQTFARLESLLASHSPLLLDSLSPPLPYGRSDEALLSLQRAIAPYTLPQAVIDSYLCHDGQDSLALGGGGGGGGAGAGKSDVGLVYGLWWLPLERVEEEWRFWRRLEAAGGLVGAGVGGDAFSASSSAAASSRMGGRAHPYRPEEEYEQGRAPGEAEEGDLEGMSAFPPGWVRARYSHPGWLPLLTDRCGNYIGVDLDPPPPSPSPSSPTAASSSSSTPPSHSRTNSSSLNNHGLGVTPSKAYGQPGQVIAFGREMDDKVVLFPGDGPGGWARFLAAFVDEVERGEVARLGEGRGSAEGRWGDEESGRVGGGGSSGEEGEGAGAWDDGGDGLGERGYFESAGVYGDEGEDVAGRGGARAAQTWILRAPSRRLAAQLSLLSDGGGGMVGLLAERSRRKWRSLGVGTRVVAPAGPGVNGREPLKVVVPNGAAAVAAGEEEEPKSAATMKAGVFSEGQNGQNGDEGGQENQAPPLQPSSSSSRTSSPHPLAPIDTAASNVGASSSNVELTFSPPSPTATFKPPALPSSSSSQPDRRTSHDSSRSRTSSSHDGSQYLQQPSRRSSGSAAQQQHQQQRRQPRRPPPPPAAPIGLPTFSELDFSDALADPAAVSTAGYGGRGAVPIPTATWLLNDGAERSNLVSSSSHPQGPGGGGGLMSRLSFGSAGPTPTRESLLPMSRPPSAAAASPPSGSPSRHSSSSSTAGGGEHHAIPVHSREATGESDTPYHDDEGTDDVPLRVPDERSRSTTALVSSSSGGEGVEGSPPTSPTETLEVVVESEGEGGGGGGVKRGASPGDQPYGEREGR